MRISAITIITIIAIVFTGCKSQKDLAYFEDIKNSKNGTLEVSDYQIKIVPQDELLIVVNSEIPSATAQYNTPTTNPGLQKDIPTSTISSSINNISSSSTPKQATYIVNKDGDIDFPILGKIHVVGMTINELKEYLKKRIEKTVKDPQIYISLVNFKINVIGEVKEPQTLNITTEKYSLIDAISACGDLTEYGKRDNIIIIREQPNGELTYGRINLHDSNFFKSPYYYLQQNDVVYIEPNSIKQDNSKFNQYSSFKLSTISTIVSAASVIASLVIALTIK